MTSTPTVAETPVVGRKYVDICTRSVGRGVAGAGARARRGSAGGISACRGGGGAVWGAWRGRSRGRAAAARGVFPLAGEARLPLEWTVRERPAAVAAAGAGPGRRSLAPRAEADVRAHRDDADRSGVPAVHQPGVPGDVR